MAQTDFSGLDDEEFMAEWTALGEKVQADRELLKEYSVEHQRRERLAQLQRMDISPSDVALLQTVKPEGVESEELVGAQDGEN